MKCFFYWLRCLISSLLLSLGKWRAQTSRLHFLLELRSNCRALVQIRCIPFFFQSEFSFSPFWKKPLKQAKLFSIFWRPSVQWRPKHAWKNVSLKKIAWCPFFRHNSAGQNSSKNSLAWEQACARENLSVDLTGTFYGPLYILDNTIDKPLFACYCFW